MIPDVEERLKRAYLAEGGTEAGFETKKGELIAQYRNRVVIDTVLDETKTPPNANDLIRRLLKGEFDG
jgi:hypothetical protein